MATKDVQLNEKEVFATTSSSVEPLEANEAALVVPERDFTRAIWTIVWAVALPCIPLIIISSLLLYIIFQHRLILQPGLPELQALSVQSSDSLSAFRRLQKEGGRWAYYVQYQPSTITTIASWTSRIVPYLSSSIMALVALFAARHIVLQSKHGNDKQLPNPDQLALLIGTLGGSGFAPLREVILYRFLKKGKLVKPLPTAISAFTVITILAILIPVVDTWFGIATTAQTVTQIGANSPSLTYGRGISSSACPNGPADNLTANANLVNTTEFWPCNVFTGGNAPWERYIFGLGEAGNIVLSVSNTTKLRNYTDTTGSTFWYLGAPTQNSAQDYQAKTFATSSQCRPMTFQQCNITYKENSSSGSGLFHCNENFVGEFGLPKLDASANGSETGDFSVGLAFSGNAALTDVTGRLISNGVHGHEGANDSQMYRNNPLHYGFWAFGSPGPDIHAKEVTDDPAYYYGPMHGGVWMLNCSTTVYDVTYTWVNGTITSFNKSESSPDMAAMLSGPFSAGYSQYIQNSLGPAALTAGSAGNSAGIAELFADQFSRLALAYSIGALEEQPVLKQQDRIVLRNIARVPLIPLYLLLATKAFYAVAVIGLAVAAYAFTHPAESQLVKDQLSIQGLTAAHFVRPDITHECSEHQSSLDATGPTHPQVLSSKDMELSGGTDSLAKPGLRRASTAPNQNTTRPIEAKVGLMPAVDGKWQFVVKANGTWNSVKPIVET